MLLKANSSGIARNSFINHADRGLDDKRVAHFLWLLAQARVESAYFSSLAEGKAPPLASPQHGGARFSNARGDLSRRLDKCRLG
jgi:hypothetical protein